MRTPLFLVAALVLCTTNLQAQNLDFPRLLDGLTHPSSAVRSKAREVLEGGGVDAARALMAEFHTKPLIRAVPAAAVLHQMGPKAGIVADEVVAILRQDATPDWQWNVALQLLDKLAPERRKEVVGPMTKALSAGPLRQHAAIVALTALGAEGAPAIPALKSLAWTLDRPLKSMVLHNSVVDLAAISWTAPQPAYDRVQILEALYAVGGGEADIAPLARRLAFTQLPSLQLDCASLLGKFPGESRREAVRILAGLLHDKSYGIRDGALAQLGELAAEAGPAAPEIAKLLRFSESLVRVKAAETLGMIGPAAAAALPELKEAAALEEALDPTSAKPYHEAITKIERKAP